MSAASDARVRGPCYRHVTHAGRPWREMRSRDDSARMRGVPFRHPPRPGIPTDIEEYRDGRWCREATRQIETAMAAERFIEQVGFTACLHDSRRPGPSLY